MKANLIGTAIVSLFLTQSSFSPTLAQNTISNSPPPTAEASAQNTDSIEARLRQVDAMVCDQMSKLNMPAYCLTVIKSGKVVFHKPYGLANIEQKVATANDTVFGLASLTKTFTALTLLSLVDKGLVGLDDPLSKYLDGLTPEYGQLTIRQLASMTAGVPSKLSQEVLWKDQLPILLSTPLKSQPGSAFLYSNFSYRLIGSVITKVTARPYLEVVKETILAPLYMTSTATTVLLQPTGRVAQGYGDNQGQGPVHPIEYKNPAISFSAGMLASTNDDLVNYVFGLMSGKMLSPAGYQTLWYNRPALSTGQPSKWAFGWAAGPNPTFGGKHSVMMNGGTPGVASTIIIIPEEKSAVIALCNLRKPPVYKVAKMAAKLAFGNANDQAPEEEEQQHSEAESD